MRTNANKRMNEIEVDADTYCITSITILGWARSFLCHICWLVASSSGWEDSLVLFPFFLERNVPAEKAQQDADIRVVEVLGISNQTLSKRS